MSTAEDIEETLREAERRRRRRRRPVGTCLALAAGVALVWVCIAVGVHPIEAVWFGCLLLLWWSLIEMGVDRSPTEDAELEPLEIVEVSGRNVVVRNRDGHLLTWRVRRSLSRRRPSAGPAWGTSPVRRLHPAHLVVEGSGGPRWFAPAEVAVYYGPTRPAVVVDEEADDSRIRGADPVVLLAKARDRIGLWQQRMGWLTALAVVVTAVSLLVVVIVGDGASLQPLAQGLVWGVVCYVAFRGLWVASRDLQACPGLELVEADGDRFDPRVRVRTCDGTVLTWTVGGIEPIPKSGPLWVTSPAVAGRKMTIVLPAGREGVRVVRATTNAEAQPAAGVGRWGAGS